jgi:hypothetical protein
VVGRTFVLFSLTRDRYFHFAILLMAFPGCLVSISVFLFLFTDIPIQEDGEDKAGEDPEEEIEEYQPEEEFQHKSFNKVSDGCLSGFLGRVGIHWPNFGLLFGLRPLDGIAGQKKWDRASEVIY